MNTKNIILPQNISEFLSFCVIKRQKFLLLKANKSVQYIFCPSLIVISKNKNIITLRFENKHSAIFIAFYKILLKFFKECNKNFAKKLLLKGMGFKIVYFKKNRRPYIRLKLGLSHFVKCFIPVNKKFTIAVTKNSISVKNKNQVYLGNFCQKIKNLKKLNVYTGKGFFYKNQKLSRKIFKKK